MKNHIHITIDQVSNGWICGITRHSQFSPEPQSEVMIAESLGDAFNMVGAAYEEGQKPQVKGRGGWQGSTGSLGDGVLR